MMVLQKAGVLTSVMDLGRTGYQRHGVVVGGALDRFAARVVNAIVGNEEDAAVLEFAQLGPEIVFERDVLVAWTGADYAAWLGKGPLHREKAVRVAAGERLWFGPARRGLRGWLAVAGGLDVPIVLGSRSTYRRAQIGGFEGRRLRDGDRVPLGTPSQWAQERLRSGPPVSSWSVRPETLVKMPEAGVVRAVPGPEWEWFTIDAREQFYFTTWKVTKDADRMGVRLQGPELARTDAREMISEAAPEGAVQVPAGGTPIVLLASRQTVGGYPRIACVASVDLCRVAQFTPGTSIRFELITLDTAHGLLAERERNFFRVRTALPRLTG